MTTESTTTFKSSVLQSEHTSALLIKLSNNRPCTYAMKSDFPYKSAVQIVCCIKSDVDLEKFKRENRETRKQATLPLSVTCSKECQVRLKSCLCKSLTVLEDVIWNACDQHTVEPNIC